MNTPDTPTPEIEKAYAATPREDLRRQIMDCNVPKNEREHWAARHIEQLERELTAAKEELAATKELLVATQSECLGRAMDMDNGADREIALEDTIALLRTESLEQARLLGMSGEREADLRGEIERLRRRVEAADELAEEAQILANILRANTDVHGRCLLERDMTIGLRAALLTFRATEGKK